MGRPKQSLNILPRTLWWRRTESGYSLRVSYGIRSVAAVDGLTVEQARAEFRRLHAKHRIERVARESG
jgi:hypothetical protein